LFFFCSGKKVYDKKTGLVAVTYKSFKKLVEENETLLEIFNSRLNNNVAEIEDTDAVLLEENSEEE
jgi:uncharacterized protein (DUF488 family)